MRQKHRKPSQRNEARFTGRSETFESTMESLAPMSRRAVSYSNLLQRCPNCHPDTAGLAYRIYFLDVRQPLRSTEELRGSGGQRDWDGIRPANLLPAASAATVRDLLRKYLDQRILFYVTRDKSELERINASTAQLQTDLWSSVQTPALALPTPVMALAVAGMNDVLNSQGYTQFAWGYNIPVEAWALMELIAAFSNLLVGYGVRRKNRLLFLALPLAVALAFFLIADIDSPRRA